MGVVMLGRYTRVRWQKADPEVLAALDAPGATARDAAALLDDAEEVWGLAPGQPSLIRGTDVDRRIVEQPGQPAIDQVLTAPQKGIWLVAVEHSGSMWAALRGTGAVDATELDLVWRAIELPGSGSLVMGLPQRRGEPFRLMAPLPRERAVPALLDRNDLLLTTPFQPEGKHDEAPPSGPDQLESYLDGICNDVTPCYRYGLLSNGKLRWLDLRPEVYGVTATPVTSLFRARLDLFRRELAARGIYYEDDGEEAGYELRFAIEDGAVPPSFHEPDAALAYTVSGEGAPEDDRGKLAQQLYDPEGDWETGQYYALSTSSMPARVDVKKTSLVYHTSEYTSVDGSVVDDAWAEAHLEVAGFAAGLDKGASYCPALTAADVERLEGSTEPLIVGWTVVDAADRVQRAAYVLATGGVPDAAIERRLSQLRGPIVRMLLGGAAIRAAEEGHWAEANALTAALLPLVPGPFPSRAYPVIGLADALADNQQRSRLVHDALWVVDDPLERRLALLFAEQSGGAPTIVARGAATWAEAGALDDPMAVAHRWRVDVLDPLFGH